MTNQVTSRTRTRWAAIGTVIGKALAPLNSGTGTITALIVLQ